MATATGPALQATTISPTLTVDDVQQSIEFFESLGFSVKERWDEQGKALGAMLQAGDASIGVSQDDWKKGRDRDKGIGMRLYIDTKQDVDQLASRAKAAGLKLDAEPYDTEWKSRAFDLTEPSGFKITIESAA